MPREVPPFKTAGEALLEGLAKAGLNIDVPDATGRIAYGRWWITYDPPPIPARECDWQFWHDDYDGAPDGNDHRCGHAASLEAAKAEIDAMEAELAEAQS